MFKINEKLFLKLLKQNCFLIPVKFISKKKTFIHLKKKIEIKKY